MTTNHYSAAKVLDELMLQLMQNGREIPAHVVEDLKAGRSLASLLQRQPDDADIAAKATIALQNVEMNLLALAQQSGGTAYADQWQRQIIGAYQTDFVPEAPTPASKFVSGVPKGQHWIRILAVELAPVSELEQLLTEAGLSAEAQEDGYLLIHGEREKISGFLKNIRQKVGKAGSKCKE